MTAPEPPNTADVVIFDGPQGLTAGLAKRLEQGGARVDVVADLNGLRAAFFRRGGHDALVIGPDVPPGIASRAAIDLIDLDARVRVVAFGSLDGTRPPGHVCQLALHPASSAAAIAVLRAIRA